MQDILEKRSSLPRQLSGLLQQNEQLRSQAGQLQSLANIGSVSLMIAHEINNILTPLAGYAQLALANPDDKALAAKVLTRTARNTARAKQLQDSLLALTNGETLKKQNHPLIVLVEQVFSGLCRDFAKDGITVTLDIPEDLQVRAVPVQIQQVLMNLILNAREAMLPAGGLLSIKAGETADTVWLRVSDTGCGIDQGALAKIFDPFYTDKTRHGPAQRKGNGLGLTFCKRIIDAHDGSISVESQPGKGTCFKILLPKPRSSVI